MNGELAQLKELLYKHDSLSSDFIENTICAYKGTYVHNILYNKKLTCQDLFLVEDSLDDIKVIHGYDVGEIVSKMSSQGREKNRGAALLKLAFVHKDLFDKTLQDYDLQKNTKVMLGGCQILPTEMNLGRFDIVGVFEGKFKMMGIGDLMMLGKIIT